MEKLTKLYIRLTPKIKSKEGQEKQVLSDLFFEWIKLVDKLKPKIAIAENVKGMLIGNAKLYTKQIIKELNSIGYDVQLFLLNSKNMGLGQKRERVFFICKRKDLKFGKLKLNFNEKIVKFKEFDEGIIDNPIELLPSYSILYDKMIEKGLTGPLSKIHPKGSFFNQIICDLNKPLPTITAASTKQLFHPKQKRCLTKNELCLGGSYPLDFNFNGNDYGYIIGMSVPPIMMANISYQIYKQLFLPKGLGKQMTIGAK